MGGRKGDAGFSIDIELFHGSMDANPDFIHCSCKGFLFLVWVNVSSVPAGAATYHVEDDELVNEQKITLHLGVKRVRDIDAANVVRTWLDPHAADFARVTDLRKKVKGFLWYSDPIKELVHDGSRSMPPANM